MRSRRIFLLGTAVALLIGRAGHGQAQTPEQGLNVYAGVTVYCNPAYDSVSLVEFPFSVNRNELDFFRPNASDTTLYARIFAEVDIMGPGGLPVDSASTYFSVRAASGQEVLRPDIRIFNKLALFLKPQDYTARLTVIDVVSKRKGELFLGQVSVKPAAKDMLSLSDLCLAYDIRSVSPGDSAANARLARNGLYMIPNPNHLFSEMDTMLFVYGEIYNLAYTETAPSKYETSFAMLDDSARTYNLLGRKTVQMAGKSAVIAQSIDLKGWPPGFYKLQITVKDLQSRQVDTAVTPFRIISRERFLLTSRQSEVADPYDTMSHQSKLDLVQYLLTPDQKQTLANLTRDGQESFLGQYWKEHDRVPGTPAIENRLEAIDRFNFANLYFSTDPARTDGWRTDRGRIYLIYGLWDEREEVSSPRIGNPYEIWHYRQLKEGKYFVFEEQDSPQNYRLVHSNVNGEVFDKGWDERINEELLDIY